MCVCVCVCVCVYVCVCVCVCVCVTVCISSLCGPASTDLPDPLSPPVSIVHHTREVFMAISCIGTELLYRVTKKKKKKKKTEPIYF